jgi:hypothetical protein
MGSEREASSAKIEHERLRRELEKATTVGGETADAARDVLKVLLPHMLLEEEWAAPPLMALRRIALGEFPAQIEKVLRSSEMMKAELPRMLDEHKLIVAALRTLLQAASKERHDGFAAFAQKLILHAQQEEEIFYPAAILVGEYVKLRLGRGHRSD